MSLAPFRRAFLFYGSHAVVCGLVLAWLVPFGEWPLRIPFDFSGDGIVFSALLKAIAEDGPLHAQRIGAPFGSALVDWPLGMWLPLGVTSGLVAVIGDAGVAINLYWLLSLVVAGLTATWSLVRLSVPRGLAFVFGMFYAFLPYGFYRNVAHVSALFPLVPLVALLTLRVAGSHPDRMDRTEQRVLLGACLAQGLSYVYYAFFGCLLLIGGGVVGWWRTRETHLIRLAGAGVLLLSLGTAIPLIPSFVHWARHGPNPALAYKTPGEADVLGLKIRSLLMPRADHPVGALRGVAHQVTNARFPGGKQHAGGVLGLAGSLGFLVLLGHLLGRASGAIRRFDEELGPAAVLTFGAVLVAGVGGFGSLFNALVSPDVRDYSRIAVFIGFFSLYAAAVLAGRVWTRLPAAVREHQAWAGAALTLLLGLGIGDQVPLGAMARVREATAPTFSEADSFVTQIERRLPAGSMVFQLPHQSIPVSYRWRPTVDLYDGGRAYFSSRTLRWSWGSMIGRSGDWQMLVARLPPASLVRTLALAGFSGIWVDRRGYPREGEAARLEVMLAEASSGRVEVSGDRRYSFFDLRGYRQLLEVSLDPATLADERSVALTPPFRVRWRAGCSEERLDARSTWRECGPSASAVVRNPFPHAVRLLLTGQFRSDRPGRLSVDAGGSIETLAVGVDPVPYRRDITIGGSHPFPIRLSFDAPCGDSETDRCLDVIDFVAFPQARGLQGAGES